MRLVHSGQYYEEGITHMVSMNLTESGWHHLEDSTSPANTPVSRKEFQTLLVDVDRLLIRATYHLYQSSARSAQQGGVIIPFPPPKEVKDKGLA